MKRKPPRVTPSSSKSDLQKASQEKEKIMDETEAMKLKKIELFAEVWDTKMCMLTKLDQAIEEKRKLIKEMTKNLEDISEITRQLASNHKEKQRMMLEVKKAKSKLVANEEILFRRALEMKLQKTIQEKGEEHKIEIPISKVRDNLALKMPIIMAIFLLMTNHIDQTTGNQEFRPVQEETPWFDLTPQEEVTMVEKENMTITLQTDRNSPFLSTTRDAPTPGYITINNYVDLNQIARDLHNSKLYMESHQKKRSYFHQDGYRSIDNLSNKEFKSLGKRGYENCELGCSLKNSSLPTTSQEVKDGAQLLRLPLSTHMWVPSTQESQKINNGYKTPFSYKILMTGYKIFPQEKGNIPYNFPVRNCKIYKNGKQIKEKDIGFTYNYYSSEGKYHVLNPYRLEVDTNKILECRIIVHQKGHTDTSRKDEMECICLRDKLEDQWKTNQLEIARMEHKVGNLNKLQIEDWRIKTEKNQISEVEEVEQNSTRLVPRNANSIDNYQLKRIRSNYIWSEDITELRIISRKTRSLPAKDMFKKLIKTLAKKIVSNPHLVKNLYKEVKTLLQKDPNTITRPTKELFGTNQKFLNQLNRISKDFHITRNNSIIKILPIIYNSPNWKKLEESNNPRDASRGIQLIKQSILFAQKIQDKVIPAILENILISEEELQGRQINMEEDSIIQISITGTILKIETNIPIQLKTRTRIMQTIPLPQQYEAATNEFIIKDIPKILSMTESDNHLTPCLMGLLSQHTTQTCPNIPVRYDPMQILGSIGAIDVYLCQRLGTISISCPAKRVKYYPLEKQVNILLVHKSCTLQASQGNYHLQTKPNSTMIATDLSSMLILSYDIHQDYLPDATTRWILSLTQAILLGCMILGIISCIVGILIKRPFIRRIEWPQSPKIEEEQIHSYKVGMNHMDLEEPVTSYPFQFNDPLPYETYYKNIQKLRKSDGERDPSAGKSGTSAEK